MSRSAFLLLALYFCATGLYAQSGFVRSGGQPIPGATVTASQGSQTFTTVTDADGHYGFPPLAAGAWTVSIDMFGFDPEKRQVDYEAAKGPVNFDIQLKESPLVRRMQQFAAQRTRQGAAGGTGNPPDFATQALEAEPQNGLPNEGQTLPSAPGAPQNGNESYLISGSLSPGMAQGAQSDSGPDMRFAGPNPFGGGSPRQTAARALPVSVVRTVASEAVLAEEVAVASEEPAGAEGGSEVAVAWLRGSRRTTSRSGRWRAIRPLSAPQSADPWPGFLHHPELCSQRQAFFPKWPGYSAGGLCPNPL